MQALQRICGYLNNLQIIMDNFFQRSRKRENCTVETQCIGSEKLFKFLFRLPTYRFYVSLFLARET